ncbi:DUF2971 domain-containing protein [Pseudomonas azerbaijanorientalis]|uniref:DUF2971 domain-containing protein n=1 Tax=Pseudomonas azerbaijanorientalis TaxID=2842350 RepID=UPI001C3CC1AA|nr:DUF2971 domain-containing protein [Pseudomonas azerbaijanorientalis]QXH64222.1 DUF2971 domain-containing protein [Pseudomonas azerbaijanorientalis]
MNDSQELNEGVAHVLEELASDSYNEGFLEGAREMLLSEMGVHVSHYVNIEPTFVCSFSQARDALSQWRAYGDYAIEFDSEIMDIALFQCIYDEGGKRREIESMVSSALYGVAAECIDNEGAFGPESVQYLETLVRVASTIKNQSFNEEKEVRCLVDVLLPSDLLKFREKSGVLIPYVVEKIPFEAIKAIHIGPMRNQELAFTAMKAFVSSLRYRRVSELGNIDHKIDVVMSNIPYRAL